jgi:hypothetical protein
MKSFVEKDSVVREIWGKGDTILFIFTGASAEFALNKAVDWLYFTGKLPADPLARLFSTVNYARQIIFLNHEEALNAIDKITSIHTVVENKRGDNIPDWAYRDVLFMLIHYSISSFEVLERKLTEVEKEEVFNVFYRVGTRMRLKGLPENYSEWLLARETHLNNDLEYSKYTKDLFKQYKKHLGVVRYKLLLQAQTLVVPKRVNELLKLGKVSVIKLVLRLYKLTCYIKLDWFIKWVILPSAYKKQIKELDVV